MGTKLSCCLFSLEGLSNLWQVEELHHDRTDNASVGQILFNHLSSLHYFLPTFCIVLPSTASANIYDLAAMTLWTPACDCATLKLTWIQNVWNKNPVNTEQCQEATVCSVAQICTTLLPNSVEIITLEESNQYSILEYVVKLQISEHPATYIYDLRFRETHTHTPKIQFAEQHRIASSAHTHPRLSPFENI